MPGERDGARSRYPRSQSCPELLNFCCGNSLEIFVLKISHVFIKVLDVLKFSGPQLVDNYY